MMTKKFCLFAAIMVFSAFFYAGVSSAQCGTCETEKKSTEAPAGKVYMCDACKVTMDAPGKCPVCGMDLVAKVTTTAAPATEAPVPAATK